MYRVVMMHQGRSQDYITGGFEFVLYPSSLEEAARPEGAVIQGANIMCLIIWCILRSFGTQFIV